MREHLRVKDVLPGMVAAFNAYIRRRDRRLRCISCGSGAVEQAGHYWPTSLCPQPSMRFNEKNVNGQCVSCNIFKEGNRQGYRKGLIKKYGRGVIEELDVIRSIKQNPWGTFEYKAMIKFYQQKIKEFAEPSSPF